MNFLKLLDPYVLDKNDISSAGRQQQQAVEKFPGLVRQSALRLFENEKLIVSQRYILIGVAASFSLPDLRFLDIVNRFIMKDQTIDFVYAFNLEDFDMDQLCKSVFGFDFIPRTPIAKIVFNGKVISCNYGHDAITSVFKALNIDLPYADVSKNTCPPTRELLEEY